MNEKNTHKKLTVSPNKETSPSTVFKVTDPKFSHISYNVVLSQHTKPTTKQEIGDHSEVSCFTLEEASLETYSRDHKKTLKKHVLATEEGKTKYAYENIFKIARENNIPIVMVDMFLLNNLDKQIHPSRREFLRAALAKLPLFGVALNPLNTPSYVRAGALAAGLGARYATSLKHSALGPIMSKNANRAISSIGMSVFKFFNFVDFTFNVDKEAYILTLRNNLMAFKARRAMREKFADDTSKQKTAVFPVGLYHADIISKLKKEDSELLSEIEKHLKSLVNALAIFMKKDRESYTDAEKIFFLDAVTMLESIPKQLDIKLVGKKLSNMTYTNIPELKAIVDPLLAQLKDSAQKI